LFRIFISFNTSAFQFLIILAPIQITSEKLKKRIHTNCFTFGINCFKISVQILAAVFPVMCMEIIESVTALFTNTSIKIMFFLLAFLAEKQRAY